MAAATASASDRAVVSTRTTLCSRPWLLQDLVEPLRGDPTVDSFIGHDGGRAGAVPRQYTGSAESAVGVVS
jgi:hypothetical protein